MAINLQGSMGVPPVAGVVQAGPKPNPTVGVKAVSPVSNIPKTPTTLPKNQVAPRDLSSTYANVGGTIYNKQSQTKFSNQADFFKDSGLNSFSNVKFDTAYAPSGKETIYGVPQGVPSTVTPSAVPSAPAAVPPPSTGPYTPPNQGTTGVSQGGIIGNLINFAQNESPAVTKAREDLKLLSEKYAERTANIESSPIDLSLANGEQGILNRLFAAKQGAAQTALSNALTSQGQQIGATSSAGSLNAPIIASPGEVQIAPSQPNPGSTTSGAANLNSLVGKRQIPGQKQVEFFDKTTGQGFKTPQELADFVNRQTGGNTATAQNVFSLLEQTGSGGSNIIGGNTSLNPLANIPSLAQAVINGQLSYPDAIAQGGNVSNFAGALTAAILQQNPGFNFNIAQGASNAQQQSTQITGTAGANSISDLTQQSSQLKSILGGADANFRLLIDTARQGGVNDTNVPVLNTLQQNLQRGLTSSAAVTNFRATLGEVRTQYANILGGGTATDMSRGIAADQIPDDISLSALQSLYDQMTAAANNRIEGIDSQIKSIKSTPASNNTTSSNGSRWGWNP